jgi:glutathione S-transferase
MKLFYSATSPFVRKCLICAHELGLFDRLELVPAAAHPVNRDRSLVAVGWRERRPDTAHWFDRFGKRDSMMLTRPPAG